MRLESQPAPAGSRWQTYAKAGAVFVASTASYLLARSSGALNWLWGWQDGSDSVGDALEVGAESSAVATTFSHSFSRHLLQSNSSVVTLTPGKTG